MALRSEQLADDPSKPNLSVKDVAAWLGVDEQTVRNLCKRRLITYYRVEGLYRFTKKHVREYLAGRLFEQKSSEAAPRPPRPKQKLKHLRL